MIRTFVRFTLVAFVLTMCVSAFAASKAQDISLYQPVQLNGTTISPGHYTVRYETSGNTAQVKIMKGKKEVANATGQTKQLTDKSNQTALLLSNSSNGQVPSINEIHFSNSATAITFDSGMSSAGK